MTRFNGEIGGYVCFHAIYWAICGQVGNGFDLESCWFLSSVRLFVCFVFVVADLFPQFACHSVSSRARLFMFARCVVVVGCPSPSEHHVAGSLVGYCSVYVFQWCRVTF